MTEKCTKTSSPVESWITPYPFAPLNHFTVPFSLTEKTPFASALRINFLPLSDPHLDRPRHALQKNGRAPVASLMEDRSRSKRKRLPQFRRMTKYGVNRRSPENLALFSTTQHRTSTWSCSS